MNENNPQKASRMRLSEDCKPYLDSDQRISKVYPSTAALARLWISMQTAFGHKWTAHMGQLPVKDDGTLTVGGAIWMEGLEGFSDADIFRGFEVAALDIHEWPPNLPQFRSICFGIPMYETVCQEIRTKSAEKSAFTRLVWSKLDTVRWRMATEELAERLMREAYTLANQHVMSGEPIPGKPAEIAPPEPVDDAAKAMATMQMFAEIWGIKLPDASKKP